MSNIIGRKAEQEILNNCMTSNRSEFVVVYGRRRVGKTFLIKEFFNGKFDFSFVGTRKLDKRQQLTNFASALKRYSKSEFAPTLKNWFDAFDNLSYLIENSTNVGKKVIFIDEMPWIETHKSDFVLALEHFWNSWANLRNDIVFIACGSATSWIVDKIFHNKGGLFNRATRHIYLRPFFLNEVEDYLHHEGFNWDRYQIAQCYMTLGGIPFYLTLLKKELSLAQNIDSLFFNGDNSPLRVEYQELFSALFNDPEKYVSVVTNLALHREGLTRNQIIALCNFDGAGLTKVLTDLERCDFIFSYSRYGNKSNNAIYRIKDFYTLFYYKFVEKVNAERQHWVQLANTPQVKSWQGFSYELLCLLHLEQIKNALSLNVMLNSASSWRSTKNEKGAQIDLVIDRADRIINLCEIKFANNIFIIDKNYEQKLRERMAIFSVETKTRHATVLTMITTFGVLQNTHSSLVNSQVTLEDLFRPIVL